MSREVRHDADRGRFYVPLEAGDAELDYRVEGDVADFRSTFVPPEHRGEGIAERIVLAGLRWARERGLRVEPTCPYVAHVLGEHAEFADLTVDGDG